MKAQGRVGYDGVVQMVDAAGAEMIPPQEGPRRDPRRQRSLDPGGGGRRVGADTVPNCHF